jgi:hypothetical protein
MGDPSGGQRLTRRMAPLRNCMRSASEVPGGVFPMNSSRFIFSSGVRMGGRWDEEDEGGGAEDWLERWERYSGERERERERERLWEREER